MHPAISYELATVRIADLRRQAQRDALTCAPPRCHPARRSRAGTEPRSACAALAARATSVSSGGRCRTHRSCSTARPPLQAGAMYIVT